MLQGEGRDVSTLIDECTRNRQDIHLPRRPRRLVVRILFLHRRINFSNCEPLLRATEDGAAEDNGKGMLRAAIGVGEACQGIGAVGVWLVWGDGDIGLTIVVLFGCALRGYGCWRG